MSEHRTNSAGVGSLPRDYRGDVIPATLPGHALGIRRSEVTHACPECGIGLPQPFCQVCLGAGTITTERLDRYQVSLMGGVL